MGACFLEQTLKPCVNKISYFTGSCNFQKKKKTCDILYISLKDMSDMRLESPTRVADSDRKLHSVLGPPD